MTLAAILLAQAVAATPSPVVWNNITLGVPAATLRPLLGDPLRVLVFDNGNQRIARYWLPGNASTYVLVIEGRGYIKAFHAFTEAVPSAVIESVTPDPLGIRLGESYDDVKSKAPQLSSGVEPDGSSSLMARVSSAFGVVYSFQTKRVHSFHWSTANGNQQPQLPPLSDPSGDSTATAILDVQKDEASGVDWEYRYLSFNPCADNARWQLKNQSLVHEGTREYDRLHVVCAPTKAERDFYFDITSYFGKL